MQHDPFDQWLAEQTVGPGNRATSAALFESWSAFMARAGYGEFSKKRLAAELLKRGFKTHRGAKGVRQFLGLRVTH